MLVAISRQGLQVWEEGGKWETKRWEGEGDLGWARCSYHTCTSLGNGRLLLIGGLDTKNRSIPKARLLDANNGFKAEVIQAIEFERNDHTATLVSKGNKRQIFLCASPSGPLSSTHAPSPPSSPLT